MFVNIWYYSINTIVNLTIHQQQHSMSTALPKRLLKVERKAGRHTVLLSPRHRALRKTQLQCRAKLPTTLIKVDGHSFVLTPDFDRAVERPVITGGYAPTVSQ